MSLRKPLPLLLLLYACCQQLHAQQPTANRLPATYSMPPNPASARAMDSLQKWNEIRANRNHTAIPYQQLINTIPPRSFSKTHPLGAMRIIPKPNMNRQGSPNQRTNTVCYTISGRDFLYQDSLVLYSGNPSLTADGNVIVSGEFADYSQTPLSDGGFCMKTDAAGNVIWAKLFDSTNRQSPYDYVNYFRSLVLQNGNILLAGRTTNRISGNDDFALMMLDNNGNTLWQKTYESRLWQGFNGSGDYLELTDMQEDPATGSIYFTGNHWTGVSTITKLDPADGHIIWSTGYGTYDSDYAFGMVINGSNLVLFQLENGYYNDSYIDATVINKTTGDTLYSKHWRQTGDLYAARLYNVYSVVKLNNGHYRMSGPTTHYFEFPTYTGTVDLNYAGIIELDENLDFVNAWGFKNRIQGNTNNTRISLYPDGSGVFTMMNVLSGYNAEAEVCLFRDQLIYHQRRRFHNDEGIPYEPPTLQMPDGGYLNIKLMGDSTKMAVDGSRIDYYRMHTADTPSVCLGIKDTASSIWYFNFESFPYRRIDSLTKNVFRESRVKQFDSHDFAATPGPSCVITSNCDTLHMEASTPIACPGTGVTVTIHKNAACGSLVPLTYDTNFVSSITKLNDTTYSFMFNQPGSGYINGSLMGCQLRKDSVHITVLPARNALNLGPDTVICPGNHILLNAGKGFASYTWQDGSADSTLLVNAPGKYYVTAANGCGATFSDTVMVNDHPPIPISIGPDRFKCNNDTIKLTAPSGFIHYTWSSNYNISSLTSQQVIVNPLKDTMYTVAAEKTPGCFAYDTVYITVATSPKINLGGDTSICKNDSLQLDAGSGFNTYQWSTGNAQQQVGITQPGTYSVKATTIQGCSSFDTLKLVSLYELPKPYLGPDSVVCVGQFRTLNPKGQYKTYLWSTGAASNTITINTPGQYWLAVTDVNGCHGADTTVVPSLQDAPTGFLGIDTAICTYGKLVLEPSATFIRYIWNTGASVGAITITQPGNYWLQVTDKNNCTGRDTVAVTQKDCLQGFYIPNAFTPNGDGYNDLFRPLVFGDIKSFRFQVYNQWGQLVFQTTTPGEGWNGEYKGRKQDTNAFVWICVYQLNRQPVEKRTGTVLMIR